jgi:hypothetical protein
VSARQRRLAGRGKRHYEYTDNAKTNDVNGLSQIPKRAIVKQRTAA